MSFLSAFDTQQQATALQRDTKYLYEVLNKNYIYLYPYFLLKITIVSTNHYEILSKSFFYIFY
jgi:hypothetical protein